MRFTTSVKDKKVLDVTENQYIVDVKTRLDTLQKEYDEIYAVVKNSIEKIETDNIINTLWKIIDLNISDKVNNRCKQYIESLNKLRGRVEEIQAALIDESIMYCDCDCDCDCDCVCTYDCDCDCDCDCDPDDCYTSECDFCGSLDCSHSDCVCTGGDCDCDCICEQGDCECDCVQGDCDCDCDCDCYCSECICDCDC